jgi:hypothetical protein
LAHGLPHAPEIHLTGLALYTMAALMVGYFGVNAYTGKYGLNARQELDQEIVALTSELGAAEAGTGPGRAARFAAPLRPGRPRHAGRARTLPARLRQPPRSDQGPQAELTSGYLPARAPRLLRRDDGRPDSANFKISRYRLQKCRAALHCGIAIFLQRTQSFHGGLSWLERLIFSLIRNCHGRTQKNRHQGSRAGNGKEKGQQKGFGAPPEFTKAQDLAALRDMLLIRRFEEKAGQLYGMGAIGGFCHLYIGQEAIVVGMQMALKRAIRS